jgi:hypothetical protein
VLQQMAIGKWPSLPLGKRPIGNQSSPNFVFLLPQAICHWPAATGHLPQAGFIPVKR